MGSSSLNILNVLVIESSVLFQKQIERIFENTGINFVSLLDTSDGAVEALLANDLDVIILDISLPGGDAFSLLMAFAHHSPTTPVIVTYSQHELPAVYSALSVGATTSIEKPFNKDEFYLVLQELFPHFSFSCSNLVNIHLKLLSNFIKQILKHSSEQLRTIIYSMVNNFIIRFQEEFDHHLAFDPWRGEFYLKKGGDKYLTSLAEVQVQLIDEMYTECVKLESESLIESIFSEAYNAFFWENERFVNILGFMLPYHLKGMKSSHTQLPFYVEHFFIVSLDGRKMVHYSREEKEEGDQSDYLFSSMLTAISQLSEETSNQSQNDFPRTGLQKIEESGKIILVFRGQKSRAFLVVNREIPGLGVVCEQIVQEFEVEHAEIIETWAKLGVFEEFNELLKQRIKQLEEPYQFLE